MSPGMECDCQTDSVCTATSTYCRDGTTNFESSVTEWLNLNSVLTAAATLVLYLLYRLTQVLPVFIRWPIRLICSLTGLSSMWSWFSYLVGTLRGIQSLCSWLACLVRFITGSLMYAKQLKESVIITLQEHIRKSSKGRPPEVARNRATSSNGCSLAHSANLSTPFNLKEPDLRLILLGPSGGGRTSLADTLLGCRGAQTGASTVPLVESTRRRMVVDGLVLTVVDTPDLLGSSLGDSKKALEALRSIQLANPGPHAILLVLRAPCYSDGVDQDVAQPIGATRQLFGDGVTEHILPVLTHADCLGAGQTLPNLLAVNTGGLRTALSPCDPRAELVDNSLDCPPEARRAIRRQLLERVVEMKALRGRFIHELQRKTDCIREELLSDMAYELTGKL